MRKINCFRIFVVAFCLLQVVSCREKPENLLTEHAWQATHVWAQISNTQLFYERGNSLSTLKLEIEYIKFNKDGSGIYSDNHGVTSPLQWHFTDSAKTKLTFTVQFLPPATSNWDILLLTEKRLEYVQRCIQGTTSLMSFEQRVPKQ